MEGDGIEFRLSSKIFSTLIDRSSKQLTTNSKTMNPTTFTSLDIVFGLFQKQLDWLKFCENSEFGCWIQ